MRAETVAAARALRHRATKYTGRSSVEPVCPHQQPEHSGRLSRSVLERSARWHSSSSILSTWRWGVIGPGARGETCLFLLSNRSHCYVLKAEQHNAYRREEELLDLLVDVLRPRKRSGEGTSSVPNRTANSPSEASVDAAHLAHIRRLMRLQQKHMQESHPRRGSKVV